MIIALLSGMRHSVDAGDAVGRDEAEILSRHGGATQRRHGQVVHGRERTIPGAAVRDLVGAPWPRRPR